jgi:hypothetical protein
MIMLTLGTDHHAEEAHHDEATWGCAREWWVQPSQH